LLIAERIEIAFSFIYCTTIHNKIQTVQYYRLDISY